MITTFLLQVQSWFAATSYGSFKDDKVAHACNHSLFGLPNWYEYLTTPIDAAGNPSNHCTPAINGINDFWLIGLAIIEIMLRIAVLIAICFVLYGGAKYVTSRGQSGGGGGQPDKLNAAKLTVYDALTGLAIAIVAAAVVSYIGGRFSQ